MAVCNLGSTPLLLTSIPLSMTLETRKYYRPSKRQLDLLSQYIDTVFWPKHYYVAGGHLGPTVGDLQYGLLLEDISLYLQTGRNKEAFALVRGLPDDKRRQLPQWLQELCWYRIPRDQWNDYTCFANTCFDMEQAT